jgi:hypothetical protein
VFEEVLRIAPANKRVGNMLLEPHMSLEEPPGFFKPALVGACSDTPETGLRFAGVTKARRALVVIQRGRT